MCVCVCVCVCVVLALAYFEGVVRLNIFKGFAKFSCVYTPTTFVCVTYKLKGIAYFLANKQLLFHVSLTWWF